MNSHRLETKAVRLVGEPHHQCTAVLPVGASRHRRCRSLWTTHGFVVFRIDGVCILVQVGICHLCKMKMVGRDPSGNRVVPFGRWLLLCSFLPSAPFSAILLLRPVKLARRALASVFFFRKHLAGIFHSNLVRSLFTKSPVSQCQGRVDSSTMPRLCLIGICALGTVVEGFVNMQVPIRPCVAGPRSSRSVGAGGLRASGLVEGDR